MKPNFTITFWLRETWDLQIWHHLPKGTLQVCATLSGPDGEHAHECETLCTPDKVAATLARIAVKAVEKAIRNDLVKPANILGDTPPKDLTDA